MLPLAGIAAAVDTRLPQTQPRHRRRRGHHRPKTSLRCIGVLVQESARARAPEFASLAIVSRVRACERACVRAFFDCFPNVRRTKPNHRRW